MDIDVDKVQIPSLMGDITVLSELAPRIFMLKSGFIRILDMNNNIKDRYLINIGFAEYNDKICKIMVKDIQNFNNLNVEKYREELSKTETDDAKNKILDTVELINLEKLRK